jgi:CheY-like chemotaxis protein
MAQHRDAANRKNQCVILYAEDDDSTAYLFQKALDISGTEANLFRVDDGEKALAFLFKQGVFQDAPEPNLVVLDLHLPKKSGFEVLEEIRRSERWKELPVVMFSSLAQAADRERALALGAREFFRKSSDWEEFVAASRSICELAQPVRYRYRSSDEAARHIDYCLHLLGLRIRKTSCEIIARMGDEWAPIGERRPLPVVLPAHEAMLAGAAGDSFILTIWQYEHEHPGTDIRQVLTGEKPFETALAEHT